MRTVELIYDGNCPNVAEARAELMRAFSEAGVPARWVEWNRADPARFSLQTRRKCAYIQMTGSGAKRRRRSGVRAGGGPAGDVGLPLARGMDPPRPLLEPGEGARGGLS